MLGMFPASDGKWPPFFQPIPCVTLKDIPIDEDGNDIIPAGTDVHLERMPNDRQHLMIGRLCIKSNAVEGVDFNFSSEAP